MILTHHVSLFIGRLVPFLENSSAHASALIIMAISVERFYAICRPLKVKIVCTFTGTAKIVSALWIIAASAAVPFSIITYTDEATFYDNSKVEVCRTHIRLPWQRIYVILTIMTFFVVPLLVLLTLYTLICRQLVKQSGDPKTSSNPRTSLSLKLRRQVVIMLCIITSLFFLCLLPFKVVSLWTIYAPRQEIERLGLEGYLNLLNFSRVMYYINSAINPVVYNLISTRFRNYFKHSITCGRLEPPAVLSRVSTWNNSRAGSRKSASSTSTCIEPVETLSEHATSSNNSNYTVNISLISVPEKDEFI